MARMPKLGRPISVAMVLSMLVLAVTYGGMEVSSRVEAYRRMRALDRAWRDRDQSSAARVKATEMLAELGPEAADSLMEAARDEDDRVREAAYRFLAGLEPIPDEATAICLAALGRDVEPRGRAAAAMSLGAMAYTDRESRRDRRARVIAALRQAGRDESPLVRRAAVQALIAAAASGVDPGPWLEDPDRAVRLAAAEAILWLDPAHKGRMVPALQAMVLQAGPDHPGDVYRTLGLLYRVEPSACRNLVPSFIGWLRHEDAEARGYVVAWLGHLGPMAREATPALEAMLDRGRPADRTRAAFAIINIDPTRCDRAAAALLAVLSDAALHPRDRALALGPFDLLFKHPHVPAGLRAAVLGDLRAIPDQPGIHPELGLRIRQLVAYHGRPPRGRPGASARLISAH